MNLFADMGVAAADASGGPRTCDAPASTRCAPTSAITSPANGAHGPGEHDGHDHRHGAGSAAASSAASRFGRRRHHLASGERRDDWTYTWSTGAARTVNIRSRAVDDSGNVETPAHGRHRDRQRTGAAELPVQHLDAVGGPGEPGRARPDCGRARRQVPSRRRRLHHRHPLLQEPAEHRHAHRQPVDDSRARCSATATFTERDRVRLAAGELRHAGRDRRQHDLRRVVSHRHWLLRRRQQLLRRRRRRQRPAARARRRRRAAATASITTARAAFPTEHVRQRPTTGWTSCSCRRRARTRRRPVVLAQSPSTGCVERQRRRRRSPRPSASRSSRDRRSTSTFELRDASNALVPATVTYDASDVPRDASRRPRRSRTRRPTRPR